MEVMVEQLQVRQSPTLVIVTPPTRRELSYGCVTFIITERKVAVCTKLQSFILEPAEPYYHKRLSVVKMLIETGVIKSFSDLAMYSGGRLKYLPVKRDWIV